MSDLDLARRVVSGDEASAEAFFHEYFPRLYRYACIRLDGDADAAEDVVQVTLIRAVRKLHTYRGEATLFTWLCTLCRHELGAWAAVRRRHATQPLEQVDRAPIATPRSASLDDSDPEHEAGRRELRALVQLALDELPLRYGQALEWKYLQGLGVEEIADRLGVGYKAAESLLSRAREAFRDGFAALAGGWPMEHP